MHHFAQLQLLLVFIAGSQAAVSVTRSSNDGPHPSAMEISVRLPQSGQRIRVPLTRRDDLYDIPVTVLDEGGASRTFSSRQLRSPAVAHYRDIDSGSVVSVRRTEGGARMTGHVTHAGATYLLEPVGQSGHRVTREQSGASPLRAAAANLKLRRKRQTNRSPTDFTVELHMLLDSEVWLKFIKFNKGDESLALTELNYYYTHILNGMDTVFRNMGSPSVSVSCVGMTLSKTPSEDLWLPSNQRAENRDYLNLLSNYVSGQKSIQADHVMAFTGRPVLVVEGRAGFAPLNEICRHYSVSVVKDNGLHCWSTAAHELGHNMGAGHDGVDNECKTEDKYVMSPKGQFYTAADITNSYHFSECSKRQIAQHIRSIGSSCCLLSTQPHHRMYEFSSLQEHIGTRLSLDQVCQLAFNNPEAKYYEIIGSDICAGISCTLTKWGSPSSLIESRTKTGLRAPVGTPCGGGRRCDWSGKCMDEFSGPGQENHGTPPSLDEVCQRAFNNPEAKHHSKTANFDVCAKLYCRLTEGTFNNVRTKPGLRAPPATPCGGGRRCDMDGKCT